MATDHDTGNPYLVRKGPVTVGVIFYTIDYVVDSEVVDVSAPFGDGVPDLVT